jgi:hypothetical protein
MLRRSLCIAAVALSLFVTVAAVQAAGPANAVRPDGTKNRAAWMAQGTFGVMTHYLLSPTGNTPAEKTAELSRIVDRFDVDSYVRQVQETGADWLIFTIGQTTGYLCSPNPAVDAKNPGHTPRRDIALEIAQRLKPLGKRLILYFPSEADADPCVKQALGFGTEGYAERYFEFLRQYSLKFGTLHHGWWFDACGPHPDAYWNQWLAALRAGNPDVVVAFSQAEFCCGGNIQPVCRLEDYHAGEIHLLEDGKIRHDFLWPPGGLQLTAEAKLRKPGQEARFYMPDGPFVGGVQWHGLLPIDLTFNPAIPNQFCHYTDQELLQFVRAVKSVGGALTINVPIDVQTGRIEPGSQAQLVRLSKALGK